MQGVAVDAPSAGWHASARRTIAFGSARARIAPETPLHGSALLPSGQTPRHVQSVRCDSSWSTPSGLSRVFFPNARARERPLRIGLCTGSAAAAAQAASPTNNASSCTTSGSDGQTPLRSISATAGTASGTAQEGPRAVVAGSTLSGLAARNERVQERGSRLTPADPITMRPR